MSSKETALYYQNVNHEEEKIPNLLSCFKKANLTLETQKQYIQAQGLWKIVKNNQSAKLKTIASRPHELRGEGEGRVKK